MLVLCVLKLAAMHHSRRVFTSIAPMLTLVMNEMLDDDFVEEDDIREMLYDLTLLTLETDDPVFYEAFFSALEKTTSGAEGLLVGVIMRADYIEDFAWYSYLGVVTGQDTGAYAVLRKYLGNHAIPTPDLMNAFEQIQTPAMIKYLVETGQYAENLPYRITNPYEEYTSGKMSYEGVLEIDRKRKQAGHDLIVLKMVQDNLL